MEQIVLWGTGKNAVDFKMSNKSLRIICCIDSYRKEDDLIWDGVPIYTPSEAKNLLENNYVVVASSESVYLEIKDYLCSLGKREFIDFTYHTLFEKKIAVIYGNCHTFPIKQGLMTSSEFQKKYGFYPLPQIQEIKNISIEKYNDVFKNCDLFIHQSIRRENRYGEEYSSTCVMKNLKKSCTILAMPNLYGLPRCFFPHHDFVNGGSGKIIRDISYYPYRDLYLENAYNNKKSIKQIVDLIINDNGLKKGEISESFDLFVAKVKKRELEWDFNVLDFIISNYKTAQLFYDANHPTEVIMEYLTREIYKLLGLKEEACFKNIQIKMDENEIPIYGQVIRELGLEYNNHKFMRKNSGRSLSNRPITLDDYVEQYINWNM